ncbi:uncharacterized protein LOC143847172 isoform X1 [Tasmannia lanceolata]|uniref:uncharacterized protein LOC143847172 isoform X1 n=1 Tax=Tasmannia lanceolata TaxID=3420 RepID=UPI004064864C
MWCKITNQSGGRIIPHTIPVMFGRMLEVPASCNGVARFTFDYLCGRPVGAADYIAVSKNYHTVFISDIPVMSMRIRDKVRRFITLVDELYNHHCCLFCTAEASIDDLFQGTDEGTLFDLESFQFETETDDGKLRRDVLASGSMGSVAAPSKITSLLSGQEEMFAFRRAVRFTGTVDKLTRQPIKGRKSGGGIRFGEMERDSVLAHGAAYLLHDRLHTCSDYHIVDVCSLCRSILTTSFIQQQKRATREIGGLPPGRAPKKVTCHACKTSRGMETVAMPYVFRYLAAELATMNIKMNLQLSNGAGT